MKSICVLLAATAMCCAQTADLRAGLDRAVETALSTGGTPGLAIAVVKGRDVIYLKGFGWADRAASRKVTPKTQFYLASTTKSFTALAGALLDKRGELKLDTTLERVLPDLKLRPPLSPAEITVRDLLTMTHGIQGGGPVDFRTAYTGEFTPALLIDLLGQHASARTGRAFSYGNLGYVVYSMVLDRQFKDGWKQVVEREVLRPAGMAHTTSFVSRAENDALAMPYQLGPEGLERLPYGKRDENMHAAGGHLSTAEDLARYLELQMNDGNLGGKQVFPAEVIQATHRAQTTQSTRYGEYQREGWGLGWDIARYEDAILLSRFGGFNGFYSHLSFLPEQGVGVVVLANGGEASAPLADIVANHAYDRMLSKPDADQKFEQRISKYRETLARAQAGVREDRARRKSRPQTTPLGFAAYAGTFENPALGTAVLTASEAGLRFRIGAASSDVEVYDGAKQQFRIDFTGTGQVLAFEVQESSRPPAFTLGGARFQRVE